MLWLNPESPYERSKGRLHLAGSLLKTCVKVKLTHISNYVKL